MAMAMAMAYCGRGIALGASLAALATFAPSAAHADLLSGSTTLATCANGALRNCTDAGFVSDAYVGANDGIDARQLPRL